MKNSTKRITLKLWSF